MEIIKTRLAAFGILEQVSHAPLISTNPHFKPCKMVERTKGPPKTRCPQATIARSFNELVKGPEIDLIMVSTPDSTHYEYIRMAFEVGKNVVAEEPPASTIERGKELITLSEQKGLMFNAY